MTRCIRWAARLYPAEWRKRYGAEFDVMLEDTTLRWRDLADVLRGAAIMQMTSWMTYWKMALLAGIAGAILAGGVALRLPDQYACSAALLLESHGATQAQLAEALLRAELKILGRDNLMELMTSLDLYKEERRKLQASEVVENVFRKHVHVQPERVMQAGEQALFIRFEYPDRYKAEALVKRLMAAFQQQAAGNLEGATSNVLMNPMLPERPVSPVRPRLVALGAIAGALAALIALGIRRRTGTYAVVTMSIPKETKRFVDSRVVAGPYRDVSEYVRALIRADEEQHK